MRAVRQGDRGVDGFEHAGNVDFPIDDLDSVVQAALPYCPQGDGSVSATPRQCQMEFRHELGSFEQVYEALRVELSAGPWRRGSE